jgi:hypothetical protein
MGGALEVALTRFEALLEGKEMRKACQNCFQMKGNWWFFATFFTSFSKNVSKCLNFVG